MKTPEPENRVCDQCGAPLGRHLREGLCTRCLARFSLLEEDEEDYKVESRKQKAEIDWDKTEDGGRRAEVGVQVEGPESEVKARFGDYELLEEIAHGGMGVVYRARQVSLKRIVAVKMLLCGQFAGKAAFDRFRAEAETAAHLQHPNIVAIHAIGETEGQPYFSMDYVAGRNLADLVRDRALPAQPAARYVRKIAQAVHYAHTQGVLHRDIKPANVLIDENDEPRVTDFGIARRLVGDSEFTLTGQVVGSPNFMPPEQGAGKKVKLGPASDVYGLGALLYYLLTARPPFVAETFEATLSQVLNTEPVAPRQLNPSVARDLETICLKCLEKDPARRYSTAQELAEELDRFQKGEAIHARPLGVIGKGWRWCHRKPVVAGMAVGLILIAAIGIGGILSQWRRAEKALVRERNLADLRLRERYAADMAVVQPAIRQGNIPLARSLLMQYQPQTEQEDLRGVEWHLYDRMTTGEQVRTLTGSGDCRFLVISKDGALLAAAGEKPGVLVFNPAGSQIDRQLPTKGDLVSSLALSPDDRLLAVGSDSGLWSGGSDQGMVEIWDIHLQKIIRTLNAPAPSLAFSPTEPLLAVGYSTGRIPGQPNREVYLWRYHEIDSKPETLPGSAGRVAFSPDGSLLITDARAMPPKVWDVATRRLLGVLQASSPTVAMAFSPNGGMFATAHDDGSIRLWDASKQASLGILARSEMPVWRIAFLPGGRRLAAAESTSAVRIWDVETKELIVQHKSGYAPQSLAVVPPGDLLVTGSSTGEDRLDFWPASPKRAAAPLADVRWLCISPEGRWLLVENADGSISKLESATFRCLTVISNPVSPASLSAYANQKIESFLLGFAGPGTEFVTVDCAVATGQIVRVRTWDAAACVVNREVALEAAGPSVLFGRFSTAMAPNGRLVAAGTHAGEVVVWSTATGRLLRKFQDHSQRIHSVVFSPDSDMLASACADGSAGVRSTVDWRQRQQFIYGTPLTYSAFSPDGRLYACTCADHRVYVWCVADGKQVARLEGHNTGPHCLVFSPDGRTLATAARDATVRLWNVATGRDMGALPVDPGVRALVFAAKGDLLAAQIWRASNSFVQVWDASTAQRSPEQMLLKAPGTAIAHWRVAGPYQQPAVKPEDLLDYPFAPEQKPARVDWKSLVASNSILDLAAALPPPAGKPKICYYLQSRIDSHSDQDVLLFVGADGVLNISLNGAVVREIRIPRGVAWEHTVPLKLRQGNNEIIIKLVTRLGCRISARVATPEGSALPAPSR